jgi:hypothetical protein
VHLDHQDLIGLLVAVVVDLLFLEQLLVMVEVLVVHMQELVKDLLLRHKIQQHLVDGQTLVPVEVVVAETQEPPLQMEDLVVPESSSSHILHKYTQNFKVLKSLNR